MELNNVPKAKKFPFANAKDRLLAKTFDIFFLSTISLSFGFLIFCFDKNFTWFNKWQIHDSWRYLVFGMTIYLIYFFWMIFFPFLFNWQTIGMKIFKLKFFSFKKNKTYILKGLILHDLFIWEILINISLIISFFLFFLSDENSKELLYGLNLFSSMQKKSNNLFFYFGLAFGILYSSSFFILCFVIIGIFLCDKHPAYHDDISKLYVIKLTLLVEKKNYHDKNIKENKINLPGIIDPKSLDKLLGDKK